MSVVVHVVDDRRARATARVRSCPRGRQPQPARPGPSAPTAGPTATATLDVVASPPSHGSRPELPPDLPPEYAEAYVAAFERAYAEARADLGLPEQGAAGRSIPMAPAEPMAPAAPQPVESTDADADADADTDTPPVDVVDPEQAEQAEQAEWQFEPPEEPVVEWQFEPPEEPRPEEPRPEEPRPGPGPEPPEASESPAPPEHASAAADREHEPVTMAGLHEDRGGHPAGDDDRDWVVPGFVVESAPAPAEDRRWVGEPTPPWIALAVVVLVAVVLLALLLSVVLF